MACRRPGPDSMETASRPRRWRFPREVRIQIDPARFEFARHRRSHAVRGLYTDLEIRQPQLRLQVVRSIALYEGSAERRRNREVLCRDPCASWRLRQE